MIYRKDESIKQSDNFTAQVSVLDIPGSIKPGYSPIGHVRCGRAACRLVKTNDQAEAVFMPQQPMVVDSFANCEGLARIAFLDGNSAVMLGKVQQTNLPKTW